jgi:hypothetical protein
MFLTAFLVFVAYDPPVGLVFAGLRRAAPLRPLSAELRTRPGYLNATPVARYGDDGVTG